MAEIKLKKKLIYAGDAYRAILEADHKLAYCIERIKAVDAMEVVRCKDCKNAVDYPANVYPFKADSQKLVCTKTVNWRAVEPDHFCSYGERKDNG